MGPFLKSYYLNRSLNDRRASHTFVSQLGRLQRSQAPRCCLGRDYASSNTELPTFLLLVIFLSCQSDEVILVASPEFIAAHGEPQTLEDIGRMPTLSMGSADEHSTWRFVGMDGELAELIHLPRLCTDDLFTLRRAALQGIGAVLIPLLAVANDLEGGTLVRLLPSLKAHEGVLHAVFPSRRGMVPAVRSLLDTLSEGLTVRPASENQI